MSAPDMYVLISERDLGPESAYRSGGPIIHEHSIARGETTEPAIARRAGRLGDRYGLLFVARLADITPYENWKARVFGQDNEEAQQ